MFSTELCLPCLCHGLNGVDVSLGDDRERVDVVLEVVAVAPQTLERAQLDEALRVPLLKR